MKPINDYYLFYFQLMFLVLYNSYKTAIKKDFPLPGNNYKIKYQIFQIRSYDIS